MFEGGQLGTYGIINLSIQLNWIHSMFLTHSFMFIYLLMDSFWTGSLKQGSGIM
jgi:hypothetical protein